jgi:lysozyme family protein
VWGSGTNGIKIPQKVLGVKQDGIVGPKTLAAVNNADPKDLFNQIKVQRGMFLYRIVEKDPKQKKFLNGWLNRLNDLQYTV